MVKRVVVDNSGFVVNVSVSSATMSKSFDQRWFNLEQEALYQKSKQLKLAREEGERAIKELKEIRAALVQFHEDVYLNKKYSKKEKDKLRLDIALEIVEIDYILSGGE